MSEFTASGYDVIPDIHGDIGRLLRTLEHLGYRRAGGAWRHPGGRRAAFLGDFIDLLGDKAPPAWEVDTRAVINTVRAMIDAGSAIAILGNHELNALLYHEPGRSKTGARCQGARCGHAPGHFLRDHSEKNRRQHETFLQEYPDPDERRWVLDWFLGLPVFLDLGGLRLVHACWDPASIAVIARHCPDGRLRRENLAEVALETSDLARAIETVMKGPEVHLPDGVTFMDYGRNPRSHVRLAWWGGEGTTWRTAALSVPDLTQLPDSLVPPELMAPLAAADAPPVLVGHYKMPGQPSLGREPAKAACLDFLEAPCAYRWTDGERDLWAKNLVTVPRWAEPSVTLRGFVGELFTPEPDKWGYRGDPFLWRELRSRLSDVPLPRRESQLWLLLEDAFEDAVGHPLRRCDEAYVERYAHGGMSSGYLSQEFWTLRGIPQLVSRFSALRLREAEVKVDPVHSRHG